MLRIALAGKLASGKTAAAQALVDELGFVKVALADELKAIAGDIATWMHRNRLLWHDDRIRLLDKSTQVGRRWLQWLGTDCLRARDPGIWVRLLLSRIESPNLELAGRNIVVHDTRFLNEFEGLRRAGFLLVKTESSENERLNRVRRIYPDYDLASLGSHPSETGVDDWDSWDHVHRTDRPIEETRKAIVDWASWRMKSGLVRVPADVVRVSAGQEEVV